MTQCGVVAASDYVVPTEQTATSWIVFDLDSAQVIAAKDPHGRYRPASILKVLLALVVLDELKLDQKIRVTPDSTEIEGSRAGIVGNVSYSVRQLLQGLLMASGNDAAHALAQALGGDKKTLSLVNNKAKELGMRDTRAASYSGLDAPGMSTSAYDMALAYRKAWEKREFARIVKTPHVTLPGRPDGGELQVSNDNHLLQNVPGALGGKTGFTDDARHTFVGAMDKRGRRLAVVILDTTIDKGRPWEQAHRFLTAAYNTSRGASVGVLEPITKEETENTPSSTKTTPPATESSSQKSAMYGNELDDESSRRRWMWGTLTATIIAVILLLALRFLIHRRRISG